MEWEGVKNMRGQRYRARDKTVRKMGRDGLSEENLRSGEAVRVSCRETDHLTLPGMAGDSVNFQSRRGHRADDRGAGGKHRGGYSPDFKRPEAGEADDVQSGIYQTQADTGETEFSLYNEDTAKMEAYAGEPEAHKGNVRETGAEEGNISEPESGIRETSGRVHHLLLAEPP